MTREQIEARIEAYDEAAGHLRLNWTDDREERRQGNIVADQLDKLGLRWAAKLPKLATEADP